MANNTGGVIYLSSTALNSSNIITALTVIFTYLNDNQYTGCSVNSVLGGASSTIDINQEKTSVSLEMRKSIMAISCFNMLDDNSDIETRRYLVGVMDKLAENIMKKYSKWVYWNEPQHNFMKDDWRERYWGDLKNYNRLLTVKREYDPLNIFNCYHCIGYVRYDDEDPSVCPIDKCTCSNTPFG